MKTAELAASDAAFGTDLYKVLAGPGNLVFSPASIAAALQMAAQVAEAQRHGALRLVDIFVEIAEVRDLDRRSPPRIVILLGPGEAER